MKLVFERSMPGLACSIFPPCDVEKYTLAEDLQREAELQLPELTEGEISRHYTALEEETFGVNSGFYPLGSCTMKYNPKLNDEVASFSGFADIHPLQPSHTVQGALEALCLAEKLLCEITGMDNMTFQPAAGAHGELTGLLLIKRYHDFRKDTARTHIIVPDTAHGTNPASATMAGFETVSIPSGPDGLVDLDALRAVANETTAGLMLTNPGTMGKFEKDIVEIAKIVHEAGGLLYYDGANLNPVMGVVRPGDTGFDIVHLNLHKTFSTPHGGGGPGSGPVGCKAFLSQFLPVPRVVGKEGARSLCCNFPETMGSVKGFYGNFTVMLKALTYILTLGRHGIPQAAKSATLNANYMMKNLDDLYKVAFPGRCMHEFVLSVENLKFKYDVSAMDIAKCLLDNGMHPPTVYFPINVHEALMVEPTDTESKTSIDAAVKIYREVYHLATTSPETLRSAPVNTPIRRPDEIGAARKPIIRYNFT